jgi:hypothetical protein
MTHDDDDLTADEAAAYRALNEAGPAPSPQLEDRVTDALRARGLLVSPRRKHAWAALLAGGVVLFVAGTFVGRSFSASAPRPTGARFVLFLEDPQGRTQDADESDLVREYTAWAREQRAAGHLLGGEKLEPTALSLEAEAAPVAETGGPPVVGGYFVVVAQDLAAAVAVARTCPHLRHGGRIIIRPIASL